MPWDRTWILTRVRLAGANGSKSSTPINEGNENMNTRSMLTLTAVASLGLCVADVVQADEMVKFRAMQHVASAQFQDIGDVEGHALGLVRLSGLASMADGTVGTSNFVGTTDYIKGAGTFMNYNNLALSDGSVLWYKANGNTKLDGSKSVFSGTVNVVSGKGRFEGAKGDGTITGERLTPLATGVYLYVDVVVNVKK